MIHTSPSLVALLVLFGMTASGAGFQAERPLALHKTRQAPGDLEIGGSLLGVPPGQTRFVYYKELLALPQETDHVVDDSNFGRPVTISGIPLAKLPRLLGAKPGAEMLIAIGDDQYHAHYPAEYLRLHHPLLVLRVNGKEEPIWPVGVDGIPMGPYMVSHPNFQPAFRVLSHEDEAQVPWGVIRIDLRREAEVYAPIQPRGLDANNRSVQQGYIIARQNCFRCHSSQGEGGRKSRFDWNDLAQKAIAMPKYFDAYVRQPKKLNPKSQMAANPEYDDATLNALRRYFATFAESAK